MKEIFSKVGYLDFENNKFLILEHDTMKYYYFLKIFNDNNYTYPTIDEFIKLNKLILSSQKILQSTDNKDEIKISNNQKISLIPKIIYKGTAILLATVLVSIFDHYIYPIYSPNNQSNVSINVENEKKEKIINVCGIENTSEYLEIKNPSWDDLLKCVESNTNINDKYKEYTIKGINNLQKNMPNLRLDILYYNISGLTIIEQDKETFAQNFSDQTPLVDTAVGLFDEKTRTIYIRTDDNDVESTFLHELFGHGSAVAYIQKENTHINSSIKTSYFNENLEYESENLIIGEIGFSFEEAKAEMIALLANNKKLQEATAYIFNVQELSILLEASGLTLTDISNKGLTCLINTVCDMNINCFELISNTDQFETCSRLGISDINEKYLISNNIKAFLLDYYKYLINSGYTNDEAINKINIISSKCDMGPIHKYQINEDESISIIDTFNLGFEKYKLFSLLQEENIVNTIDLNMNNINKKNNIKYHR